MYTYATWVDAWAMALLSQDVLVKWKEAKLARLEERTKGQTKRRRRRPRPDPRPSPRIIMFVAPFLLLN